MKRFIAAFAAVFLLTTIADAGWLYSPVQRVGYTWYPAQWYSGSYWSAGHYRYVQTASYGTAYDAQADAAIQQAKAAKALADAAKELKDAVLELRQNQAMPLRGDVTPVLVANCAACHDAKTAAEKGGEFVLLDGDRLASLTKGDRKRVTARVNSVDAGERMPPGRQLPAAERRAIKEYMESLVSLPQQPAAKE